MRLKGIKLSGFKSFVDPTSVNFPSSMTCIVGPNGCGKSNVIDAVRWVLGESSAKNLRSESMSDVVFNGSASRKPVSRASVELLFDNSDGRIAGEYSGYNEISVRRSVEMDGQSNYYLNGTSCRKKDITNVFLGTGLGPRSYAIIEQGMISQLVSAKPEEMRGYIEEVAGISRYLERKKETESSIRKTKDNLSRLQDLREEIGRLLFKLQQQAKAAEKYTQFRKDENHSKGLLLTSKWRDVSKKIEAKDTEVKNKEIKLEEVNSLKTSSNSKIISLRAEQIELQTALDKVQQDFYSFGADISRTEQELSIKKSKKTELEEKFKIITKQVELQSKELANLGLEKERITESIAIISPLLEQLRSDPQSTKDGPMADTSEAQIITLRTKQIELQTNLEKVQQDYYRFSSDTSKAEQELSVSEGKKGELENKLKTGAKKIEVNQIELSNLYSKKEVLEQSISVVIPELEKLRNGDQDEAGATSTTKVLEAEWLLFITQSESLLGKMQNLSETMQDKVGSGISSEDIKIYLDEIDSLKQSLQDLSEEPLRLTKRTQELLSNASESMKSERLNLLNKTENFSNLQADLARMASQEDFLVTAIAETEEENKSISGEIFKTLDPIKSTKEKLSKLLTESSALETSLRSAKELIEECSQSILRLEGVKLKKEKDERIDLLDKTEEFANLQAKLATIASQDGFLESSIKESQLIITDTSKEISEMSDPIKTNQDSLDVLLKERLKVESELLKSRKAIEDCSLSINNFEREKIEKEQMLINVRESLEALRLDRQASKIESDNLEKQLLDSDNDLNKLLEELKEEKTTKDLEEELELIERKIGRLGAINLAAMEESEQEEKRKNLLDDQHQELTDALETLQNAINKIDKETRTTFKDTFDKLNISLAQSFPKLFGGGHAELVILGDDLLSAGIGITAKPPGKKNSSVAQLSGGEKALTAIAIVFAFFELNPSPFCLLDEVDAPLDDLNTMRFIDLVEEMSQRVQFVYITHNKISMEKSKHLMGVTMQEPGVSRMVAVDVDSAVEMAAS